MYIIKYSISVNVEFYRDKYSDKRNAHISTVFSCKLKKKHDLFSRIHIELKKTRLAENYCVNRSSSLFLHTSQADRLHFILHFVYIYFIRNQWQLDRYQRMKRVKRFNKYPLQIHSFCCVKSQVTLH